MTIAADIRTALQRLLEQEVADRSLADVEVYVGRPDPARLAQHRGISIGGMSLDARPEWTSPGARRFELDWSCAVTVSSGRWHGSAQESHLAAWSLGELIFGAVAAMPRLGLGSSSVLFARVSAVQEVQTWADIDAESERETVLEVTVQVRSWGFSPPT